VIWDLVIRQLLARDIDSGTWCRSQICLIRGMILTWY